MGKKGPLWWRESDWLLRGSSAANQILLRHSGPILSTIIAEQRTYGMYSDPTEMILAQRQWGRNEVRTIEIRTDK